MKTTLPETIMGIALIDSKGRISLPVRARTRLGIEAGDSLAVIVSRGEIRLIPTCQIPLANSK